MVKWLQNGGREREDTVMCVCVCVCGTTPKQRKDDMTGERFSKVDGWKDG
jgi:hypothetical protein